MKKNIKNNISTTNEVDTKKANKVEKKLYSVMVGFEPCLRGDINLLVKDNKAIKPVYLTDTFFYVEKATQEEVDIIRDAVKDIKFEMKNKDGSVRRTYKIRYVAAYKYGKMLDITVTPDKFKKPRPGAHTAPKKKVEDAKKPDAMRIKNRKSIKNRGSHSSGTNLTTIDKKTVKCARKAGKMIITSERRKEKQRALMSHLKPKNRVSKVAKQLELPLMTETAHAA